MITAETKKRAFDAFLDGKALRQIAQEPGMPCRRTLELLSVREGWVSERENARAEARRRSIEGRLPQLTEQFVSLETERQKLTLTAISQLLGLVEGKLSPKELSMSQTKLIKIVNQLVKAG